MMRKKKYLVCKKYKNAITFSAIDGSFGYWAGGSETELPFVFKKLIELFGPEGKDIYTKFNEALLAVSEETLDEESDIKKGVIVLYEKNEG